MRHGILGFWPSVIGTGLVILLVMGILVAPAFDKELTAQVWVEIRAKEQAEADRFSNMITQAEWRVTCGEWTKRDGVYYILKSESIDCPQGFHDLPPNIKIGDKVRLERKQGSGDPRRSNSFNIISIRNGG